jgi:hypothetical protein
MSDTMTAEPKATKAVKPEPAPRAQESADPIKSEQYHEVEFSQRRSEEEPLCVECTVNGHMLVFQRGQPVIVPQPFLEVLSRASFNVFDVRAGYDRKIVNKVHRFPFSYIRRNVPREEFLRMFKKGNEQRDADISNQRLDQMR